MGEIMNKDKRLSIVPADINNNLNNSTSTSSSGNFEYKPPNNTGVILGIIGGVLTTVGDALATIGAIIQVNIDASDDFQSKLGDFKSEQDKDEMRKEINNLNEKVKQLEQLIKSNKS
jgi:hypothetical protein